LSPAIANNIHIIQGEERRERKGKERKGKERVLLFEGGSSGSHYVESWLWKRLWTCRKTDY
jgi:hypothetical protein